MSKKTYSIDVTVRVVIDAESQTEAEGLVAESLLKQPNVEECGHQREPLVTPMAEQTCNPDHVNKY